jgi:hypothetical protein
MQSIKPKATTSIEVVDSDRAFKYLEGNTHNRPVSQATVEKYADIMRKGGWLLNGESIKFDWDGVLIDGQHRLFAVTEAEVEIALTIVRNLDPKAQETLDQGKPRRLNDILSLSFGEQITTKLIAVMRQMEAGLSGAHVARRRNALMDEHKDFWIRHRDALRFVEDAFKASQPGISWAAVKAALARAYYHVPHEVLSRFIQVYKTGYMDAGEEAAIALRTQAQLSGAKGKRSDDIASLLYAKTERALDAFVNRRRITQLRGVDEELYLLPEETEARKAAVQTELRKKRAARAKEELSALRKNKKATPSMRPVKVIRRAALGK